jgi:hypothetical protein
MELKRIRHDLGFFRLSDRQFSVSETEFSNRVLIVARDGKSSAPA